MPELVNLAHNINKGDSIKCKMNIMQHEDSESNISTFIKLIIY